MFTASLKMAKSRMSNKWWTTTFKVDTLLRIKFLIFMPSHPGKWWCFKVQIFWDTAALTKTSSKSSLMINKLRIKRVTTWSI